MCLGELLDGPLGLSGLCLSLPDNVLKVKQLARHVVDSFSKIITLTEEDTPSGIVLYLVGDWCHIIQGVVLPATALRR